MSSIKIVTDSTVQLSKEEKEKYSITVVPLSAIIANTVYTDEVSISKADFLHKMQKSPVLPKTSQPAVGQFIEAYNQLGADGSEILSIHCAGYLSGTVGAASQGSKLSTSKVTVRDSHFLDRSMAFQVLAAAEMAQQGASMTEILSEMERVQKRTSLFVGIVDLENLIKGGRINQTVGRISTLLNMKLMLRFTEEALIPETKGRGLKALQKKFNSILEEMKKSPRIQKIGVTHVGMTPFTERLIHTLKTTFPSAEIHVGYASPTLMTHTGTGAFAITYLTE